MESIRLFALPGAGSSAIMYYKWIPLLSKKVRLSPLEIPGRGMKIKSNKALNRKELIELLFANLKAKLKENEDYMLLGNSFSSILALDICKLIELENFKKPKHLFLAVEPPSKILKNRLKMSNDIKRKDFIREVFIEFFDKDLISSNDLNIMLDAFLKIVYTEKSSLYDLSINQIYQKIYGNNKCLNKNIYESLEFAIEHIKLFFEDEDIVSEAEINSKLINVDMTVFGATNDEVASEEELFLWKKYTNGNFNLKMIDGNHLILINNNKAILEEINSVAKMIM